MCGHHGEDACKGSSGTDVLQSLNEHGYTTQAERQGAQQRVPDRPEHTTEGGGRAATAKQKFPAWQAFTLHELVAATDQEWVVLGTFSVNRSCTDRSTPKHTLIVAQPLALHADVSSFERPPVPALLLVPVSIVAHNCKNCARVWQGHVTCGFLPQWRPGCEGDEQRHLEGVLLPSKVPTACSHAKARRSSC